MIKIQDSVSAFEGARGCRGILLRRGGLEPVRGANAAARLVKSGNELAERGSDTGIWKRSDAC